MKAYTNFRSTFESGLTKMVVIGLGKQAGTQITYENTLTVGYEAVLREVFAIIQREANLVGGVALVENFYDRLVEIEALPAADLPDGEGLLLERAYEYMPTLPYDELDVLVVDRLGKDIPGRGIDTNVIGRYDVLNTGDLAHPDISASTSGRSRKRATATVPVSDSRISSVGNSSGILTSTKYIPISLRAPRSRRPTSR